MRFSESLKGQLQRNFVALVSIVIAVGSLSYNTWRNEASESHRNFREASFRVLESMGELQEVADHRYYYFPFEDNQGREGELRLKGFGRVTMVRDLMNLMPSPAPEAGNELFLLWNQHFNALASLDSNGKHSLAAKTAERELTDAIRKARGAVFEVLVMLD